MARIGSRLRKILDKRSRKRVVGKKNRSNSCHPDEEQEQPNLILPLPLTRQQDRTIAQHMALKNAARDSVGADGQYCYHSAIVVTPERSLSVDQVPDKLDIISKSRVDDDNASLEALASPSASSSSATTRSDAIDAISVSWIDPTSKQNKDAASPTSTIEVTVDNSFEWDDSDAYNDVCKRTCSPNLHDYSNMLAPCPYQNTLESSASSILKTKKQKDKSQSDDMRVVRFSSPISTVLSFDKASAPGGVLQSQGSPTAIGVSRRVVKRIMSPIRAIEYIYNSTTSSSDDGQLSPVSAMTPLDTAGIWRRDATLLEQPLVEAPKQVDENTPYGQDPTSIDEDEEVEKEEEEGPLRIVFTPSIDLDDLADCESPDCSENSKDHFEYDSPVHSEDSEDTFDCESPVSAQPPHLEPEDTTEVHSIPSLTLKKLQIGPFSNYKLHHQQPQWSPVYKILTILLAISCLSGHASHVLNRFDVPNTVVGFFNPNHGQDYRRALRRRRYQGRHDKFDSPGQFLDVRQNNVGVWLA